MERRREIKESNIHVNCDGQESINAHFNIIFFFMHQDKCYEGYECSYKNEREKITFPDNIFLLFLCVFQIQLMLDCVLVITWGIN